MSLCGRCEEGLGEGLAVQMSGGPCKVLTWVSVHTCVCALACARALFGVHVTHSLHGGSERRLTVTQSVF